MPALVVWILLDKQQRQTLGDCGYNDSRMNERWGIRLERPKRRERVSGSKRQAIQGKRARGIQRKKEMSYRGFPQTLALPLTSLFFLEIFFLNDNGTVCSFSCCLRSCFQIFHGAQICSFLLHIRLGQVSTPTLLS